MTDKTTQEPVLYQRWYQGVWFKVNPGDVEKLESDGWSIRRLYADQPAPVAVVLPEHAAFEAWVSGRKVCKKYGAKLTRRPDGSYADFRINDRHLTWNACLDKVKELNQ